MASVWHWQTEHPPTRTAVSVAALCCAGASTTGAGIAVAASPETATVVHSVHAAATRRAAMRLRGKILDMVLVL